MLFVLISQTVLVATYAVCPYFSNCPGCYICRLSLFLKLPWLLHMLFVLISQTVLVATYAVCPYFSNCPGCYICRLSLFLKLLWLLHMPRSLNALILQPQRLRCGLRIVKFLICLFFVFLIIALLIGPNKTFCFHTLFYTLFEQNLLKR
jgi:hypothetical protein